MISFFFSSVRCLPSLDLSYFCCVPRGMNSPSINISIVISAGRPRVTFRKMSWNWFLTFISQSGWGLFLARRVFTHPTCETRLKLKGYSVSAWGLAQFFCDMIASLGKKGCARWAISLVTQFSFPYGDVWMADRWGWDSSFNRYARWWEPWCPMSWALCHTGDLLLNLLPRKAPESWPEWCWCEDAAGMETVGTELADVALLVLPPVPVCPQLCSLQCVQGCDTIAIAITHLFKLMPSSDPFLCLDKSWCLS